MKKSNFLIKLKRQDKLEVVEPSEDICNSYIKKADDSLKSAKVLLQNNLYENSVSMSYYTMYNSLTALLFKVGIKCENHSGSIILFKKLFGRVNLYKTITFAKKERIDKQYYVDFILTKESAIDLLKKAEDFLVKMKIIIKNIGNEDTQKLRKKLKDIL
jgi:uncharacterized protein (UPF0332 family)